MTFRFETGYRHASVPYWTGRQGITPPGANYSLPSTNPADFICSNGSNSGVTAGGATAPSGSILSDPNLPGRGNSLFQHRGRRLSSAPSLTNIWQPDLRKSQWENTISIMVKF